MSEMFEAWSSLKATVWTQLFLKPTNKTKEVIKLMQSPDFPRFVYALLVIQVFTCKVLNPAESNQGTFWIVTCVSRYISYCQVLKDT